MGKWHLGRMHILIAETSATNYFRRDINEMQSCMGVLVMNKDIIEIVGRYNIGIYSLCQK